MTDPLSFLDGSVTGAEIRARDWSGTPLGPPSGWPPALRNTLALMLACPRAMFLAWGPDLLCFYNDAYRPILGYRLETALGRPFRAVWASIWPDIEPLVAATLSGESRTLTDLMLDLSRAGQPERSWWSFTYSPVRDDAGAINGLLCVTAETTAQVEGAARLRESEDHFRHTVELNPQVPWTCDPAGNITSYSSRWLTLTGQAPGEPLGTGWSKALHPDDLVPTQAVFAASLASGEPVDVDYRIRIAATDTHRWMRARAWPRRDGRGTIVRWYGVVEDIHDRKLAEAALREANATLERRVADALAQRKLWADVFETTDALVGALDTAYRVLAVNRAYADAFARLYGVRPRVGDDLLALLADRPEHRAAVRAIWERALSGEAFSRVETFGDPERERSSYELKFTPLRDAEGRRIGAFQYAQDVTARLRDQEQLARTEEALRQSQKMEAVGQLTGGLAHDFNNLLAGITGSLELMQTRIGQGRLKDVDRYMAAAQGAAQRAAALTHRLLAFSRRQTLDPRATDVNRLVAGMEELIRRTVGPAVRIETDPDPDLWPALVDPHQLENALLNLCLNARDAMPEGGRITIVTANRRLDEAAARAGDVPAGDAIPPGAYLSLCVADTGTGMSPEVVARAFDPFFTTKPTGQGTGLGLSMIYGFARQSGGQVRIASTPGRGTRVCLYLPRHDGPAEAAAAVAGPGAAPRAERGETVLVVDDEPTVRMLVTEVLEDLGYTAIEAGDSAAGLRVLHSDVRVDLLVTDVGLPGGMNGRQMADAGRARRPALKVLFITGYADTAA
ncbi:PAS domain-containing protein, partial [Methylobacterium sp. NEAU 140]|uniref:PAS domain-containing protein n=1 Tax=Methylobacterium sp. NEAU 140 TaxID=3064945 RepID=UPI002736C554